MRSLRGARGRSVGSARWVGTPILASSPRRRVRAEVTLTPPVDRKERSRTKPRIECVSQRIAEPVEAEDGDRDRSSGHDRQPRVVVQKSPARVDHLAPVRSWNLGAQPQEGERGLGEDGKPGGEGNL